MFLGGITSCFLILLYMHASSVVAAERTQRKMKDVRKYQRREKKRSWLSFAFIIQLVAWWAQIHPGHGIFERVKPALLDSVGQAIGVAPMFSFLEGLWFWGLTPELHASVKSLVANNRAEICASGVALSFCG